MVAGVTLNVVVNWHHSPAKNALLVLMARLVTHWAFGLYKTACLLLEQFSRCALDFLLLAFSLGFTVVGLCGGANGFVSTFGNLLMSAVYRVAVPGFAKVCHEGHSFGQAYLDADRLLACLPFIFFQLCGTVCRANCADVCW